MPSSPAARISANERYGFPAGSGERSSIRSYSPFAAGIRMSCERFSGDQVTFDQAVNVSFGPTKQPQLTGRAER